MAYEPHEWPDEEYASAHQDQRMRIAGDEDKDKRSDDKKQTGDDDSGNRAFIAARRHAGGEIDRIMACGDEAGMQVADEIAIDPRLRVVRQAVRGGIGNGDRVAGVELDLALVDDIVRIAERRRAQMNGGEIAKGRRLRIAVRGVRDAVVRDGDAVIGIPPDETRLPGTMK
jgi:hypothetical protein